MSNDEPYWIECSYCHEVYDRSHGVGKHQECDNRMAYGTGPRRSKERRQWDHMRKGMSPFVFERDNYRCRICGTTERLSVDHVVPLHLGGTNEFENLQTLCLSCNCRKGAELQ